MLTGSIFEGFAIGETEKACRVVCSGSGGLSHFIRMRRNSAFGIVHAVPEFIRGISGERLKHLCEKWGDAMQIKKNLAVSAYVAFLSFTAGAYSASPCRRAC